MRGQFRFIVDGECVLQCNNLITDSGYQIIRNYLTGRASSWCGSIALGATNFDAPTTGDTRLDFQAARLPVVLNSIEGSEIVLVAEMETDFEGKIYGLGVFPSTINNASGGFDDKVVTTFSESWEDALGVPLLDAAFNGDDEVLVGRLGYRNLIIDNAVDEAAYDVSMDTTGYSDLDAMTILYKTTATGSNRVIDVTLYDDQFPTPATMVGQFSLVGSSTGYKIATLNLGNFVKDATFNGSVSRMSIVNTQPSGAVAEVELDAIKVDDLDSNDPNFSLVSHALVGTPGGDTANDYFQKISGTNLTIEYRITVP
jgi:hypothetical protein